MIRFSTFAIVGIFLSPSATFAMCKYVPPTLVVVEVEACTPIENNPDLLVIGKVVAFTEINDRSAEPPVITRVEGWEETLSERFIWVQSEDSIRDCQFIETQKPYLLSKIERPCCDQIFIAVSPDGTERRVGDPRCIENLRELSEI